MIGALQDCSAARGADAWLPRYIWRHTYLSCLQLVDSFQLAKFAVSFQLLVLTQSFHFDYLMVSQGSSVDTSVSSPVVSPTTRLVAGTSVLATIIPSSIGPQHAIPGANTSAGKYVLFNIQSCNVRILAGSSFGSCSCNFYPPSPPAAAAVPRRHSV